MADFADPISTRETQAKIVEFLHQFDATQRCADITCLYNRMNWAIELAIRGELDPGELAELEDRGDYYF